MIFDDEVMSAMRDRNVRVWCYDFSEGKAAIEPKVDGVISEGLLERRYPGKVEPPSDADGRAKCQVMDPAQILYTSGGFELGGL
jgi:hypothetical protein